MTEEIRRVNQLEIALERIEDSYVREAFQNIMDYVRTQSGDGLYTRGPVECKELSLSDLSVKLSQGEVHAEKLNIAEESVLITKDYLRMPSGTVEASQLNLAGGGLFSVDIFEDSLSPNGSRSHSVSGVIVGVLGYTEDVGLNGSGDHRWFPIQFDFTEHDRCYFYDSSQSGTDYFTVKLSSGSSRTTKYKTIVFYIKD